MNATSVRTPGRQKETKPSTRTKGITTAQTAIVFFRSYNGIKMVSVNFPFIGTLDLASRKINPGINSISSRASIQASRWPVPSATEALPPQPESPITLSRAGAAMRPTSTGTLTAPSQRSCLHGTDPTTTRPLVSSGMDMPMNAISVTASSASYKASTSI